MYLDETSPGLMEPNPFATSTAEAMPPVADGEFDTPAILPPPPITAQNAQIHTLTAQEASIKADVERIQAGPHLPMPPMEQTPLLPPPSFETRPRHAARMALDWNGFYEGLNPDQKAAMDSQVRYAADPEAGKKRTANIAWIIEQNNADPAKVANGYEGARAAHADLMGWGKEVGADDSKFFAKVQERAMQEKSNSIAVHGYSPDELPTVVRPDSMSTIGGVVKGGVAPDTETIRKSQEESMVSRAYWSAAEESSPGVKGIAGMAVGSFPDLVTNFAKFEKDRKGELLPEQLPQRFALFTKLYQAGMEDRAKANDVAEQAFPILARAGDAGGSPIEGILPLFRGLTKDQRMLAMEKLKEMATNPKSGGGQAGVETQGMAAQAVTAAGRAQKNLLEDAFSEARQDVATRAFKAAGYEYKRDQEGENLYKELRGYAQNTLNATRKETIPQILTQTFAESLPLMAYTVTPLGAPVRFMAYKNNARSDLMAQGYDEDAAASMAPYVAAGMAGADQLTFGALTKNPLFKGFVEKYMTTAVTRAAGRLAGHTASATAAVNVRNFLVQGYVKDFAHVMDSSIPGEDWQAVGHQMAEALPETMVNMMALAAFGVGTAAAKDFKGPGIDVMARDPKALKALGFRDEQISAVVAAGKDGAGIAFLEEFKRRTPVKPGDSVTMTPARAAEFAAKAQEKVSASGGSPLNMTPDRLPEVESSGAGNLNQNNSEIIREPGFLRDALREQFPGATEEELTSLETQVPPEFTAHEAEMNRMAGVTDVFRDQNGWHLEKENGEIIDAGDVDTALQMRDQLAEEAAFHESVKALTEAGKPSGETKTGGDETKTPSNEAETPTIETITPAQAENILANPSQEAPAIHAERETLAKEEAKAEGEPARASHGNETSREVASGDIGSERATPATSISNTEMDRQAKEAGVEPSPGMPKWQAEALRKKTLETVAQKPDAAKDLVASLKKENRAITPEETFLLGNEKIRLSKLADEALVKRDNEKLPQGERDAAGAELKRIEADQQQLRDVAKTAGSIAGSQLGARQFLFTNDFTLSDLRANWRDELNDGKPLSKAQEATIKALHEELAATKKALESKDASMVKEAIEAYAAEEKAKAKSARSKKAPKKDANYYRKLREEGLAQFKAATEGKSGAGSIFLDPDAIAGAVKVVAGLIGEGYHKIKDFVIALGMEGIEVTEKEAERLVEMARANEEHIPVKHDGGWNLPEEMGGPTDTYTILNHGDETSFTVPKGSSQDVIQAKAREMLAKRDAAKTEREENDAKHRATYGESLEAIKGDAPVLARAERDGSEIILTFDASEAKPKTEDIRAAFSGENYTAAIEPLASSIVSASQGSARYKVIIRDKVTGNHSSKLAAEAYQKALGTSEAIRTRTRLQRSGSLSERFGAVYSALVESSKATKEDALAKFNAAGKPDPEGRTFSGIEKIAELTYHAARFAVGAAGEYGLKGAELAAHVIEKLGKWAKDHITAIMDLAEAMEHGEKGSDLVKEVGGQVARAEDFQKRLQEIGDAAAKEASEKLIKEVGAEAAKGEAFQKRLEKQAREASDAARKEASDKLIEEVGDEVARDEDFQKKLEAQAAKVDADEARHIANIKKAIARRTAGVEEKTAKGDFSTKAKKEPVRDAELDKLRADHAAAILKYERAKEQERLNKRSTGEKIVDTVAAWKRTAVLMSVTVYGKLATAAAELFLFTPVEDLVGGALGKVPGLSKVAEKAPRHGGINFGAQADAVTNAWSHLFEDAKSIMKTGKTQIDLLNGKEKVYVDKGFAAFVGRTHYLLKSPAKRAEFMRSFKTRAEFYARSHDVSEPLWQARIAEEAYADANRGIFMEDNFVTKAWSDAMQSLHRSMEAKKKEGHQVSAMGIKLVQGLAKFEMPIVRIPTNIVFRTAEYLFGSFTGAWRLTGHLINGIQNMTPEQADIVMRNLKRGSLGAAMFAIGLFNPGAVGGYWQQGRSPGEDEPDYGELRINGWNVPKWMIHNPLLEALQFGATVRHVMDARVKKSSPETNPVGEGVRQAASGLLEEIPLVSGVKRTVEAAFGHDKKSFVGEQLKSAIPSVVGQVARATDTAKDKKGEPVVRKPETILETLETAIPGLRQKVPTKEQRKKGH